VCVGGVGGDGRGVDVGRAGNSDDGDRTSWRGHRPDLSRRLTRDLRLRQTSSLRRAQESYVCRTYT